MFHQKSSKRIKNTVPLPQLQSIFDYISPLSVKYHRMKESWGQVLDSTNKVQQDELRCYEQYEVTMPRKQHSAYLQRLQLARERCRAQDSTFSQ